MKLLRKLYQLWKTRNWFKLEIEPKTLQPNTWYSIQCSMKNVDGEMYIEDYTLYQLENIEGVKVYKRKLKKKEIEALRTK